MAIPIYADTAALSRLARTLRAASPAAWKACRTELRAVGDVILQDAKSRLASETYKPGHGTRIAQSGKVRVTAAGNVKLVFTAPDARPVENGGKGFVRHPVFGNRQNWTDKNSHRAFAAPAVDAHREEAAAAIESAVTKAVRRVIEGGM